MTSKVIYGILGIALALISIGYIYELFKPVPEVDVQVLKGDTVRVVIDQVVIDSLTYAFKATVDSLKEAKIVTKWKVSGRDTIHTQDTLYLSYWAQFKIGTDSLGARGKVAFDMEEFTFMDVVFNNQREIITRIDTMKTTKTVSKPFYLDNWFWTSLVLTIALIVGSL